MPKRQQTQGDFGQRPTKVTQGITDTYAAPSIPAPDLSALQAISTLSKTAQGLLQDRQNTAIRQQKAGEEFGEENPDVELDLRGTTEAAMIGFQRGRGNALKARFKNEVETKWQIAQVKDENLLYDPEGYGSFHAQYQTQFIQDNGLEGLSLATFGQGMDNYQLEKTGAHQSLAIANIKSKFLSEGSDSVLATLGNLERDFGDINTLSPAQVEAAWVGAGGVDEEGKPLRSFKNSSMDSSTARQEMKDRAAMSNIGEIQSFLDVAYNIGPDAFDTALSSVTDQLVNQLEEGDNPMAAKLILQNLTTGDHAFVSRTSVKSALRESADKIDANLSRVAMTTEDRLEFWKAIESVDDGTTLVQMKAFEKEILEHPHIPEPDKLTLLKQMWKNYGTQKDAVNAKLRYDKGIRTILDNTSNATPEAVAESLGVPILKFRRDLESTLIHESVDEAHPLGNPEVIQAGIVKGGLTTVPELGRRMRKTASMLSSKFQDVPEQELQFLLGIYQTAASDKYNTLDAYGLSENDAKLWAVFSEKTSASGGGMGVAEAASDMPMSFKHRKIDDVEYGDAEDAIVDHWDKFGFWSRDGEVRRAAINPNTVSIIQGKAYALQLLDPSLSVSDALDMAASSLEASGAKVVDGHLVRIPRTGPQGGPAMKLHDNFQAVNDQIKMTAWDQYRSDEKEYDDLTEQVRAGFPASEESIALGVDFSLFTADVARGLVRTAQQSDRSLSGTGATPLAPQVAPGFPGGADVTLAQFQSMIGEAVGRENFRVVEDAREAAALMFLEKNGRIPLNVKLGEVKGFGSMPIALGSTLDPDSTPTYHLVDLDGKRIQWPLFMKDKRQTGPPVLPDPALLNLGTSFDRGLVNSRGNDLSATSFTADTLWNRFGNSALEWKIGAAYDRKVEFQKSLTHGTILDATYYLGNPIKILKKVPGLK